jgi:hypothetical protein
VEKEEIEQCLKIHQAFSKKRKFCPLELFLPLARLDDITFYSLQKGEAAKETKNPPEGMKLNDYTEDIHDFSDTAALIEDLEDWLLSQNSDFIKKIRRARPQHTFFPINYSKPSQTRSKCRFIMRQLQPIDIS